MKILMVPYDDPKLLNKYTLCLGQILTNKGYDVRRISIKNILSKFDILHLNWPDSCSCAKSIFHAFYHLSFLAFLLVLARLKRAQIVYTAHNYWPHKIKYPFMLILAIKLVSIFANKVHILSYTSAKALDHIGLLSNKLPQIYIPHLFYTIENYEVEIDVDVFVFGGGENYLSFEALEEFSERLDYSVTILGYNGGSQKIQSIRKGCSESELQQTLSRSRLIALPYKHVTNSGALYYALSANRLVLCPNTDYFREQAEKFPENIILAKGPSIHSSDLVDFFSKQNPKTGALSKDVISSYNRKIADEFSKLYGD